MTAATVDIDKALATYLKDHPDVSALAGSNVFAAGRVPQTTTGERVTLQRIGDRDEYHHGGPGPIARVLFQVDAWAPSVAERVALAEAVRKALSGYDGPMGDVPSVVSFKENEIDDVVRPADGSEDVEQRTIFTFALTFRRW